MCSQSTAEHEVGLHPGTTPASTCVKRGQVRSNHPDARVSPKGGRRVVLKHGPSLTDQRENKPMHLFSQTKLVGIVIPPRFCTLASLHEERRKELQRLRRAFFFEDRAK